jgi:hypothetical protein
MVLMVVQSKETCTWSMTVQLVALNQNLLYYLTLAINKNT